MRRLSAAAPAGTVLLALLAAGALSSCGTADEGVRLEGEPTAATAPERLSATSPPAASDEPESSASPSPAPSRSPAAGLGASGFNPQGEPARVVALLRKDPKVSPKVKAVLTPCAGTWPVTVETGRATSGTREDLVVNVASCADSVGVGTYVYRRSSSGTLVNVFSAERPPVHSTIERGRLVVTRDVFLGNEPVCCPSGRDIIVYEWRDGVFREVGRKRVDSEGEEAASSPSPAVTPRRD